MRAARVMNKYDNFENMTDFNNLYNAHLDCRKGKRRKDSVALYDIRALECTEYLQKMLRNRTYRMDGYNTFHINERGKMREIKSINYKDRVVQKCLTKYIIKEVVFKSFVYDNGAFVKGKGTSFALKRLKRHLTEYVNKNGPEGFALVSDMKEYYDSIPHDRINELYRKYFMDERIIQFIKYIHSTTGGTKGVPLGNELSQVDALLMLNELDHFIKEILQIKQYGRYSDDFYLLSSSREYLEKCLEKIDKKIVENDMQLNKGKTKIVKLSDGFTFLGYKIYISNTGKVIFKVKKQKKIAEKRRLRKQFKKVENGEMSMDDARKSYQSWRAHVEFGNTYYMLQELDCYFYEIFEKYLNNEEKKRFELLKKRRNQRKKKRRSRCQDY